MKKNDIRAATHSNFSSADLLNDIPLKEIEEMYENEISNFAKQKNPQTGCIPSTRSIFKKKGGYPVIQIPKRLWPEKYKNITEEKGQYKVMVHQLSYRATGTKLPNYSDNIDIVHLCGNGKVLPNCDSDRNRPCIFKEHLEIAHHKLNMNAQNCKPIIKCRNCNLFTNICSHKPVCKAEETLETDYKKQHSMIESITIRFKNGKILEQKFE